VLAFENLHINGTMISVIISRGEVEDDRHEFGVILIGRSLHSLDFSFIHLEVTLTGEELTSPILNTLNEEHLIIGDLSDGENTRVGGTDESIGVKIEGSWFHLSGEEILKGSILGEGA
jgi:hypothetical protein